MNKFSYAVDNSPRYGTLISLRYSCFGQRDYICIEIAPERGGNMFRFAVGEHELLGYDLEDLNRTAFTGSPILYPTPNRVRNSHYTFEGKEFYQRKNGEERNIHGLVYDEVWQYEAPVLKEDGVSVKVWYDFKPGTDCYASFPFEHRISVEYVLRSDGVELHYTVQNNSGDRLPYGFAIHPFWRKAGGEEGTLLQLCADKVCERTPDCLPTGKILPVDGTIYDLRKPKQVHQIDIDDVFDGFTERMARIIYQPLNLALEITGTEDFSHMVVCTKTDRPLLCVESQTCMTDAHNMYAKGLKEESGLQIVEPGASKGGVITFKLRTLTKSDT